MPDHSLPSPSSAPTRRWGNGFVEDRRPLPIPEPGDKHARIPGPASRYDTNSPPNWHEWREWQKRAWDRQSWRKAGIQRLLRLRSAAPCNASFDFSHVSDLFRTRGWIYAIYHFTTGKVYVGQTVNEVWERGQKHWFERHRKQDLFHDALATDDTPFHFVILPLQRVPEELYRGPPSWTHKTCLRRFRAAATPLERWWVGHLDTLWPRGWNTVIPGHPIGSWAARVPINRPAPGSTPALDPAEAWIASWQADAPAATAALAQQPKHVLRDILHVLQAKHQPLLQSAGHRSPVPHITNLLRERRTEAPARQFIRFRFSHNAARDLGLREVLRLPNVYSLHPDPPTAAAIMVSDTFAPQVQCHLMNYTAVSRDLDTTAALNDNLSDCGCRECLLPLNPDDLSPGGPRLHLRPVPAEMAILAAFRRKGQEVSPAGAGLLC